MIIQLPTNNTGYGKCVLNDAQITNIEICLYCRRNKSIHECDTECPFYWGKDGEQE